MNPVNRGQLGSREPREIPEKRVFLEHRGWTDFPEQTDKTEETANQDPLDYRVIKARKVNLETSVYLEATDPLDRPVYLDHMVKLSGLPATKTAPTVFRAVSVQLVLLDPREHREFKDFQEQRVSVAIKVKKVNRGSKEREAKTVPLAYRV